VPIRYYRKDPRSTEEKHADQDVLKRLRRAQFLRIDPDREREAIEYVERRYRDRREMVAALGSELGTLRRAHGLTQDDLASALGTAKSNISRLESGRYGGLTIERFLAVLDAIHVLAKRTEQKRKGREGRRRTGVRPNNALDLARPAQRFDRDS
jgi:transcriptional regulator with XRE-family HTH domain